MHAMKPLEEAPVSFAVLITLGSQIRSVFRSHLAYLVDFDGQSTRIQDVTKLGCH